MTTRFQLREVNRLARIAILPLLIITFSMVRSEAAGPEAAPDILVFHDGNRVTGRLIERANGRITFASERFGLLNVSDSEAEVIASKAVSSTTIPRPPTETKPATAAVSPREKQWDIQFNLALEVKREGGSHRNIVAEARTTRRWSSDEARLGLRYENTLDNAAVSTDILKNDAYWRHDYSAVGKALFTLYDPTLEWNRTYQIRGIPFEYVYLKQPIGVGWNIIDLKQSKLRLGVAENFLDLWLPDYSIHINENVESLFLECEFIFKYGLSLKNRGIFYLSVRNRESGWENDLELKKMIGESFSVSLRQEVRRNTPEVNVSNYSLWRIWFGYHF